MLSSPSDHELFGELRSLLQRPPTVGVWARLCRLVDLWGADLFALRALPYALDHLRRWPDALRRAPSAWTDTLTEHKPDTELTDYPWEMTRVLELRVLSLTDMVANTSSVLDGDQILSRFLESRAFGHISSLVLAGVGVTDEGLARLVEREESASLEHLGLNGNHLSARGVSAIARSPHMARLQSLDLRGNHWGGYEEAVAQLARTRHLGALRRLDLECDLTRGDLDTLLGSERLANLEHLGLEQCFHQLSIEDDELLDVDGVALARPIALENLISLSLSNNMFVDEEIIELLRAPWIARLRALDLEWNDLTDDAVHAMAEGGQLAGLERLSLRGCQVGEEGAFSIGRTEGFASLRSLDVSSTCGPGASARGDVALRLLHQETPRRFWITALCDPLSRWSSLFELNLSDLNLELTEEDIIQLAAQPHLHDLRTLELANVGLTPESAHALLAPSNPSFPQLVELNLNRNHDLSSGVISALETLSLPNLRHLKLRECGLTDEDVRQMASSPALERLELLDLRNNDLSAETIEELFALESLRLCHLVV